MPIYEFECPVGHRMEKIFTIAECPNNLLCEFCRQAVPDIISRGSVPVFAEKVFSLPGRISIAKPTIIFRNPRTGEAEIATHDHDTPRFGFVTEELKNPIERSRFEHEQSQRRNIENELTTERINSQRDQTDKNRHADLNAKMSSYDSQTQSLLKSAMRRSREKKQRTPPKKTNIRLDVNHIDSSNLIK